MTKWAAMIALAIAAGVAAFASGGAPESTSASASKPASGPASRHGLVYMLPDARNKHVLAQDAGGKGLFDTRYNLKPSGLALWDRSGVLRLEGGWFEDSRIAKPLGETLKAANAFTIRMRLTPSTADAADKSQAHVLRIGGAADALPDLLLAQVGDRLVFQHSAPAGPWPARQTLMKLTANSPVLLTITFSGGELACYRDGKQVMSPTNIGPVETWGDDTLTIGNSPDGKHAWRGRVDGLAIFARALDAAEAADDAAACAAIVAARPAAPVVRVQATLVEKSPLDREPPHNGTYDRAWQVNTFDVVKVLDGKLDRRRIYVAQWVWLGRVYTTVNDLAAGQACELTLEPLDAHDEMNAEMTYDDTDDPGIPRYLDIGPLAASPRQPSQSP